MEWEGRTGELVYLNGEFVRSNEAKISVWDRGFLFADGVYEVVRCYSGVPFRLEDHLERLYSGLGKLELDPRVSERELARAILDLTRRESRRFEGDMLVYVQITRGPAPRTHVFPAETEPTVVMFAQEIQEVPAELRQSGASAVTVDDKRWGFCSIKGTGLLPNVLAKEHAKRQGAFEAIFVKDGVVTEGSSSNVFAVMGGELHTHPVREVLPGITRKVVIELAREMAIPVRERPVGIDEFKEAEEIFVTSSTIEVLPVVKVDDAIIGSGRPGWMTCSLHRRFQDLVKRVCVSSEGEATCAMG